MQEIVHPRQSFDRDTGVPSMIGRLYWQCPNHGIGENARNPHDSMRLGTVMAES